MLAGWGWILLWYALVASGWFWPWYVTWAVGVVALCAWGRLSVATLLLAGGALTLYGFLPLQSSPVYGYRSLVAFGPALVYLLWQAWLQRDALREELVGTLPGYDLGRRSRSPRCVRLPCKRVSTASACVDKRICGTLDARQPASVVQPALPNQRRLWRVLVSKMSETRG